MRHHAFPPPATRRALQLAFTPLRPRAGNPADPVDAGLRGRGIGAAGHCRRPVARVHPRPAALHQRARRSEARGLPRGGPGVGRGRSQDPEGGLAPALRRYPTPTRTASSGSGCRSCPATTSISPSAPSSSRRRSHRRSSSGVSPTTCPCARSSSSGPSSCASGMPHLHVSFIDPACFSIRGRYRCTMKRAGRVQTLDGHDLVEGSYVRNLDGVFSD